MEKYAMYLRKSRQDIEGEKLGDEETLARHKRILSELSARKGLYVEKIYSEVVSGETIAARPEMQALIEDCYAGKYRGIIVVEVTRLSRGNQGDAQTIMDCLTYGNRNKGILVITPTKTYDVAHNSDDAEYLEFELFMSRREYKMIKKRMDRGRVQAVIEGNYMGSYRPYGYDILKTRNSRTLIPNEDEAPIVKQIFEWAVKHNHSAGWIARTLTSMGVPTYRNEQEWNTATIKTILMNPTYMGKVKWNDRMQVKTMVNGELVSSRPRSNHTDHYMEYDGKHKAHALVDEATFIAAKSKYTSDKTKANFKLQSPLAGLIRCAKCGKMLVYNSYRSKPGVEARYLHSSSQVCKVKSALYKDILNALIHGLNRYIDNFELKVDNLPDVDENSIADQMDALQSQLRKIEKKLSKLFDAWEEGNITNNEFVQRKAVHNERIETIKRQMADLENSIPEREEYEEKIVLLSDSIAALLDDDIDADVKNRMLKDIVDRIEYSRENREEFILDIYLK